MTIQISSTFNYERSHTDNLGLRRTKLMTTKKPAPKPKSERNLNDERTRDAYYQRIMKKQDAYEKWKGFFEPKQRPPHAYRTKIRVGSTTSGRKQPPRTSQREETIARAQRSQ